MNAATGTRMLKRVTGRRYDPRAVLGGVVILVLLNFVLSGFFYLSTKQSDAVATPVVAACRSGGAAAAVLSNNGACQAAGEVSTGVGPYKSDTEVVAGAPGTPGTPGQNATGIPGAPGQNATGVPGTPGQNATGVPGTPGQNATGVPGTPGLNATGVPGAPGENATGVPGAPGESPPCLSEPTQCRGPEGQKGDPGQNSSLPASYTKTYPGGAVESCTRNGGSDTDPVWACSTTLPPPADEPELTDDPLPGTAS